MVCEHTVLLPLNPICELHRVGVYKFIKEHPKHWKIKNWKEVCWETFDQTMQITMKYNGSDVSDDQQIMEDDEQDRDNEEHKDQRTNERRRTKMTNKRTNQRRKKMKMKIHG